MKNQVIVAGHLCLDITPVFKAGSSLSLSELLSPGKLVKTGSADVHTGGCVANTGLAMKFFGCDVKLMGKIGDDAFGLIVKDILHGYGAEEGLIVERGGTTSYSVVIAPPGVDRIFLHHSGANDTFDGTEISDEELKKTKLFHFGYPPLMKRFYEDDGAALVALMKRAKENGCMTSLDMAAVDGDSDAGIADWDKILQETLPYVDFFLPSVEELGFMLDKPLYREWQKRANGKDITTVLNIETDVAPLAQRLVDYGAKVVVIKCGAPGMYYKTADRAALGGLIREGHLSETGWTNKSGFEKSYIPDKILSGTGAGDTSIAAFLTAMTQGDPIEECMRLAAGTGASCVSAYDALSGLLPLEQLNDKIKKGWKKIK